MLNDTLLSYHVFVIDGPDSLDGTTVKFCCVVGFSGVAGAMEVKFFVNNIATNQPNESFPSNSPRSMGTLFLRRQHGLVVGA